MTHRIIRKLQHFARLSADDRSALDQLAAGRVRHLAAREDLVREGDVPRDMNLILSGWAYSYKQLEDGRRQIVGFFLPGDLCDRDVLVLRQLDHSIAALTPVTLAQISRAAMDAVLLDHPRVDQALCWETLVNAAIQREWVLNLGQRDASERMAHLLCELFLRLHAVGMTDGDTCELPPTQAELADAMGLSTVHVNRTLQELRATGLIILKGRTLRIPNLQALMRAGLFSPNYLHLDREGRYLDAVE